MSRRCRESRMPCPIQSHMGSRNNANLLVQITGFQTVQSRPLDSFKNPLLWDVSCPIWQACPALPSPISANGVEFRLTIGYLLNSFFGRFWQAKMGKRSKLLNPVQRPVHYCVSLLQHGLNSHFCMAFARIAFAQRALLASHCFLTFATSLARSSLFLDFITAAARTCSSRSSC